MHKCKKALRDKAKLDPGEITITLACMHNRLNFAIAHVPIKSQSSTSLSLIKNTVFYIHSYLRGNPPIADILPVFGLCNVNVLSGLNFSHSAEIQIFREKLHP